MRRTAIGTLLGLLGFLLLAEALCRVLPVSGSTRAGYYVDPHILSYPPRHRFRYSTGWDLRNPQTLQANDFGFLSTHDFRPDPEAIALIGDSFAEAASLPAVDRPEAQLERELGGRRPVYAMGWGGTSLLDYAERIRFAHERFGIRDIVVLMERGDVVQSLCGSGNVASQCLDPKSFEPRTVVAPPPSPLKRALRESALAQYLVSQLKVDPARLASQLLGRTPPPTGAPADGHASSRAQISRTSIDDPRVSEAVARAFFERVRGHVPGRLVIVLDSDRPALQRHHVAEDAQRARFIALARAQGAIVVDTEPLFRGHFARSRRSLDIGPYDGHFNTLGVRLIATATATALGATPIVSAIAP